MIPGAKTLSTKAEVTHMQVALGLQDVPRPNVGFKDAMKMIVSGAATSSLLMEFSFPTHIKKKRTLSIYSNWDVEFKLQ